jgi:hypothetical protein
MFKWEYNSSTGRTVLRFQFPSPARLGRFVCYANMFALFALAYFTSGHEPPHAVYIQSCAPAFELFFLFSLALFAYWLRSSKLSSSIFIKSLLTTSKGVVSVLFSLISERFLRESH